MNYYEVFRDNMIEATKNVDDKHFVLALSGGMDSTTELFAIMRNNVRPVCYTFNLGDINSVDTRSAIKIAKTFDLEHKVIRIPFNEETLVRDIEFLICNGMIYKTSIQCSQPFIYLAKQAKEDNFKSILTGLGADQIFGSGRRATTIYNTQGEEAFHNLRKDFNVENLTHSSAASILYTCRYHGIEMQSAYFNPVVFSHVVNLTHKQIWKDNLKLICYRAFKEEYDKLGFCRPPAPFQINSGIRAWHDTLIDSRYNTSNAKSIVGVYRDMRKELKSRGFSCEELPLGSEQDDY